MKKRIHFAGYEVFLNWGRTDVLAKHQSTTEILAVECCACRFTKVLNYLEIGKCNNLSSNFPIYF